MADGPDIITAISAGDPHLVGVWEEQVRAIGLAVVNLTSMFMPQVVVVGGGLGLVGLLLLDPIRELVGRPISSATPRMPTVREALHLHEVADGQRDPWASVTSASP